MMQNISKIQTTKQEKIDVFDDFREELKNEQVEWGFIVYENSEGEIVRRSWWNKELDGKDKITIKGLFADMLQYLDEWFENNHGV